MEPYTIEDIELLRQKSGISYQEAVALLDYHNGSLARALIDLEKNNRLKNETSTGKEGNSTMNANGKTNETKSKAIGILQKIYRSRVKIRKGETSIVNVSVLFAGLCLLFAPHMTIAGIIASMLLGYQFSFSGMDPEFASDNLEKMVRNAAQNAKNSVSSVVQTISAEAQDLQKKTARNPENVKETPVMNQPVREKTETAEAETAAESLRKQAKEIEETMDSFFESNPAATKYNSAYSAATSGVPTIQVPVQAETREGEVTTEADDDGYSSVTIG